MPYIPFVDDKPDIVDDGSDVIDSIRENLMALRDGIVGALKGWNMTPSGAQADRPDSITWRNDNGTGADRIRATITWGSSGGSTGNPTQIIWAFSADGVVWDTIGTQSISYDSNANITSVNWS